MRTHPTRRPRAVLGAVASILALALGLAPGTASGADEADPAGAAVAGAGSPFGHGADLIPQPASVMPGDGADVRLGEGSVIQVQPSDPEAERVGKLLSEELGRATGFDLPVANRPSDGEHGGTIALSTRGPARLGREGYTLRAGDGRIRVVASTAEGLYRGATTLRQLLPAEIESTGIVNADWVVQSVAISDAPRYGFRGAMLDVARRFYSVESVKRFIDHMAHYKLNTLHLHLTDDQGWRIMIEGRPELTTIGASTQSGWAPGTGGPWFYTREDYQEIVRYAADHFIEVMPEVDGPGHTRAAQAAIPGINCNGVSPAPYSGFAVGLPPVCLTEERRDEVRAYLEDVLTDVADQSSSDYVHIGGDEVPATTDEQMAWYVKTAGDILSAHGKKIMGWHQIGVGPMPEGALLQWWGTARDATNIGTPNEAETVSQLRQGVAKGAKVIASPADRAYLDMRYDTSVPYGLSWAGFVTLEEAYSWDPVSVLSRPDGTHPVIDESQVAGVEAALWADRAYRGSTELPTSLDQFIPPTVYADYTTFPRMPAIAEVGWTQPELRSYPDFERRTAAHADRWTAAGIGFYRAPDVAWGHG